MANIVYMARSAWTGLLDSIRSKASVSGTMTVSQATTAVDNIQTGGGGDDGSFDKLIDKTISEATGSAAIIGSFAFYSCSKLRSVSFANATQISASAFFYCGELRHANIPSATTIGSYAFGSCFQLSSAIFPSVTTMYNNAFNRCNAIHEASFPLLTSIPQSAFMYCSKLNTLYFPNVTSIGASAFVSCSMSMYSIEFPKATIIGNAAFMMCTMLETASFPAATSFGTSAFYNNYHLLSLYLMGSSVPTIASNTFVSTPIAGRTSSTGGVYGSVFVPASLYNDYITATNWSAYSERIVSVS